MILADKASFNHVNLRRDDDLVRNASRLKVAGGRLQAVKEGW